MQEGKTILSVLHRDYEAARIHDLRMASMRSLACLAASPILKIHCSFLEAAAACLSSDTYRASKIISIKDNNLSSPVATKLVINV